MRAHRGVARTCPEGHILTGSPAPRGGSPRKQTQCTKVQGKSRVIQVRSGVGRAPEAATEQDWRSSASTQPPPRTHQKQAPPLLSEHPWERTEAGRGACREDQGGGKGVRNVRRRAARGVGAQGRAWRTCQERPRSRAAGNTGFPSRKRENGVWQPGAAATGLESRRAGRRAASRATPLGPPVWVSAGHR